MGKFACIGGILFCLLILEVVNIHGHESYYEKYGPGSLRKPSKPATVVRPGASGGSRRPSSGSQGPSSGSRRPSSGSNNHRYETDKNGCPTSRDAMGGAMSRCLLPLDKLEGGKTSMSIKCSAYKNAKPCVLGLKKCERGNPRLAGYRRDETWKKWENMEREAEVYGMCANV